MVPMCGLLPLDELSDQAIAVVEVAVDSGGGMEVLQVMPARTQRFLKLLFALSACFSVAVVVRVVMTSSVPVQAMLFGAYVLLVVLGAQWSIARSIARNADKRVMRLIRSTFPGHPIRSIDRGYVVSRPAIGDAAVGSESARGEGAL